VRNMGSIWIPLQHLFHILLMIKLRLKRYGRKQHPIYRLIAIDAHARRQGKALQQLGLYDPIHDFVMLDSANIQTFLRQGACPSDTVYHLLRQAKILDDYGRVCE